MKTEQLYNQPDRKTYEMYFEKGISYDKYFSNMEVELTEQSELENSRYVPLNLQRSRRIAKTIEIQEDVLKVLNLITEKINWLVITEHWCGDSSQILPAISEIAKASEGKINLKVIYRDENPELMNAHLTNGSKSIPKLIQFDEKFNITGEFGPRPETAQKLVIDLRSDPLTAADYNKTLHKWYADDKSVSVQNDLVKLINKAISKVPFAA